MVAHRSTVLLGSFFVCLGCDGEADPGSPASNSGSTSAAEMTSTTMEHSSNGGGENTTGNVGTTSVEDSTTGSGDTTTSTGSSSGSSSADSSGSSSSGGESSSSSEGESSSSGDEFMPDMPICPAIVDAWDVCEIQGPYQEDGCESHMSQHPCLGEEACPAEAAAVAVVCAAEQTQYELACET